MEKEPEGNSENKSFLRRNSKTILAFVAVYGASGIGYSYKTATNQPCTEDEKTILAGIDVFHRREAQFFQDSYDLERKQQPLLPEMNFRELGFNSNAIIEGSKDAETFCVERAWSVNLVEAITVGGAWDIRSNSEKRHIKIKPQLFTDYVCNLVSGVIHEDIHLAGIGSEHDDVDTLEEAMQNPHYNYEQSAYLRCQTIQITYDDLRNWGRENSK